MFIRFSTVIQGARGRPSGSSGRALFGGRTAGAGSCFHRLPEDLGDVDHLDRLVGTLPSAWRLFVASSSMIRQ